MTDITKLYIGNRGSGKTQKLIDSLSHNILHDPYTLNIVFSSFFNSADILKRLPDFIKPKLSVNPYKVDRLRGTRNCNLYLDEIDAADRNEALELVHNLSLASPRSVHVNTTPLFLRDKKDLNVNHTHSRDPLIKILQITDFEFDFLFNKTTADRLYKAFYPQNKDLFYTEGLGMISLFD
jgi:hypothetical protein